MPAPSVNESCGAVVEATVRAYEGVVVPMPNLPLLSIFALTVVPPVAKLIPPVPTVLSVFLKTRSPVDDVSSRIWPWETQEMFGQKSIFGPLPTKARPGSLALSIVNRSVPKALVDPIDVLLK